MNIETIGEFPELEPADFSDLKTLDDCFAALDVVKGRIVVASVDEDGEPIKDESDHARLERWQRIKRKLENKILSLQMDDFFLSKQPTP